ncbi:MAG: hypothetical protein N2606_00525 [Candidatus Omnitrophica bacterium]|nr:hypothetical protein [Candidatus Omnitrophota bacterium]
MKNKQIQEVIYALADYKQLVLAYRSKYAELIKQLSFWKISFLWLLVIVLIFVSIVGALFFSAQRRIVQLIQDNQLLVSRINQQSKTVEQLKTELTKTQEELAKKKEIIQLLEKNISTTSKKLLERLLTDKEVNTN